MPGLLLSFHQHRKSLPVRLDNIRMLCSIGINLLSQSVLYQIFHNLRRLIADFGTDSSYLYYQQSTSLPSSVTNTMISH
ncbi:MAG: oligosaccharide flippase family protein [Lachnospiraceae bacterium]|nr:oligosaccharide flippase family protein [Lachnospiraceae bacterium]